ncbi:hypothetical protein C8J57DRAFT_1584115 [Mycena rebaudengoi]|nr:hypothetical protein C8J57DRAFT_1584115 [Mycena rebaudengoi]
MTATASELRLPHDAAIYEGLLVNDYSLAYAAEEEQQYGSGSQSSSSTRQLCVDPTPIGISRRSRGERTGAILLQLRTHFLPQLPVHTRLPHPNGPSSDSEDVEDLVYARVSYVAGDGLQSCAAMYVTSVHGARSKDDDSDALNLVGLSFVSIAPRTSLRHPPACKKPNKSIDICARDQESLSDGAARSPQVHAPPTVWKNSESAGQKQSTPYLLLRMRGEIGAMEAIMIFIPLPWVIAAGFWDGLGSSSSSAYLVTSQSSPTDRTRMPLCSCLTQQHTRARCHAGLQVPWFCPAGVEKTLMVLDIAESTRVRAVAPLSARIHVAFRQRQYEY